MTDTEPIVVVDITAELMKGNIHFDSKFLDEPDITDLIEEEEKRMETQTAGARAGAGTGTEESKTDVELAEETEEYFPSILNMDDYKEIYRIMQSGGKFREDTADSTTKSVQKGLRLSQELMEEVRANPIVRKFLAKMRPEQITEKLVTQLLEMGK